MPKRKRSSSKFKARKKPLGPAALRFIRRFQRSKRPSLSRRVAKLEKITETAQTYAYENTSVAHNTWTTFGIMPSTTQGVTDGGTAGAINLTTARKGNKVLMESIYLRWCIKGQFYDPGGTGVPPVNVTGNRCRILIVSNSHGAVLTIGDVLWSTGVGGYAMASPLRTNPDKGKTYKVLMDKTFSVSLNNPNPNLLKRFKFNKNLLYDNNQPLPSNFNIQLFMFQEALDGTSVLPLTYVSKLTFKDN